MWWELFFIFLMGFLLPFCGQPSWWRACQTADQCSTEPRATSPWRWRRLLSRWRPGCPQFSECLHPEDREKDHICGNSGLNRLDAGVRCCGRTGLGDSISMLLSGGNPRRRIWDSMAYWEQEKHFTMKHQHHESPAKKKLQWRIRAIVDRKMNISAKNIEIFRLITFLSSKTKNI